MEPTTTSASRLSTVFGLTTVLARRRADADVARELDEFRSAAELSDLAATMDRYSDTDTEQLRGLVDWTRAA